MKFSGVTFVLFCFDFVFIYAFVEAAALRSIVLRYASAPIATPVFFFFGRYRFFRVFFCIVISAFSLYGEHVVRSFLPNTVFLICDHGLDF